MIEKQGGSVHTCEGTKRKDAWPERWVVRNLLTEALANSSEPALDVGYFSSRSISTVWG